MTDRVTDTAAERVLVTGAGGFVCSHIVAALLDAGFYVLALDRTFDDGWRARFAHAGDRLMLYNVDATTLPDVPVDYLVHGAALTANPKQAGLTAEQHLQSNLDPLFAATDWAYRMGVKRAVFISSGAVYPRQAVDGTHELAPVAEDEPTAPETLYGIAKEVMERLIRSLNAEFGRPFVTIRLSNLYGPFEIARLTRPRVSRVAEMIYEGLTEGRIFTASSLPGDWTFAPDVGRMTCALLKASFLKHDLYNVTSGQTYTLRQLARAVQTHLPHLTVEGPDTPPGQPFADLIFQRPPLANGRLMEEFGFPAWTNLHDGIGQTIAWMREYLRVGS